MNMVSQDRFYYKKSRLQQFKGFCYTVQLKSIMKASKHMGLSCTAISLQIKSLEEDLRVQLFTRTDNHRLIPTKQGLRLYKKLIPIIQNVDGVIDEFLKEETEEKRNTLNIAGHHVVLTNILPKYLAELKNSKEFEKIRIKLFNIPKEEAYEKTITGEVDLMIYPIEDNEKIPVELKLTKILKYQSVVLLPKGHFLENKKEIKAEDLQGCKFLLIDQFGVSKVMNHYIEDYGIGYDDFKFKNGNWAILKALVAEKLGICSFSKYFINDNDLKNIVVKPILHVSDKIHFSYLVKENSFIKKGIVYIINELDKVIDV
jgi:DNA-binding transcriptional LysR family regulator